MKALYFILSLASGISFADEKPKVFQEKEIMGENNYRIALTKAFPDLETCFYHFDGRMTLGAFRDPNKGRILLLLVPNMSGEFIIDHNGKPLEPSQTKRAKLNVIFARGHGTNSSKPEKLDFGLWIQLKKTDTLTIKANIKWPQKCEFKANYHPDTGWISDLSKPVVDPNTIKRADAYHFSEDSLLDDVRKVLAKQATCRVKLSGNQILTLTPPIKEQDPILHPMMINLSNTISINAKEFEEKLENTRALKERLESYTTAARAGGAVPKILMCVTKKADDKLFRQILDILREVDLRSVQQENTPHLKPPRKKIHIPLPKQPEN